MGSAQHRVRIKDEEHIVTADDIRSVARSASPLPLTRYFVEIDGRRFPPKQLLRSATQTTKAFDTGVAVRALQALGFTVLTLPSVDS